MSEKNNLEKINSNLEDILTELEHENSSEGLEEIVNKFKNIMEDFANMAVHPKEPILLSHLEMINQTISKIKLNFNSKKDENKNY